MEPDNLPPKPDAPKPEATEEDMRHLRWFFIGIALVFVVILGWVNTPDSHKMASSPAPKPNPSVPEAVPGLDGTALYLTLRNMGDAPFKKVSVSLRDSANLSPALDNMVEAGPLAGHANTQLPFRIEPKVSADGPKDEKGEPIAMYLVVMKTDVGVFTEMLQFKKGKCSPWIARYLVNKNAVENDPGKRVRVMGWSSEPCETSTPSQTKSEAPEAKPKAEKKPQNKKPVKKVEEEEE